MILLALMCVLGLFFLVGSVAWGAAPLADKVGLAERSTAEVTDREFRVSTNVGRYDNGCERAYDFDVAWDDRTGHFSVCSNPDDPLTDLAVGDEVEIASVPWSSTVTPEGERGAVFWSVAILAAGLVLPVVSIVSIRRYRRLMRGGVTGSRFTGVVARGKIATSVFTGERRLVMLAVKEMRSLTDGDPAEVWSTRRSWFRKRPAGPWVLRSRGQVGAFTHAWWRKPRS